MDEWVVGIINGGGVLALSILVLLDLRSTRADINAIKISIGKLESLISDMKSMTNAVGSMGVSIGSLGVAITRLGKLGERNARLMSEKSERHSDGRLKTGPFPLTTEEREET